MSLRELKIFGEMTLLDKKFPEYYKKVIRFGGSPVGRQSTPLSPRITSEAQAVLTAMNVPVATVEASVTISSFSIAIPSLAVLYDERQITAMGMPIAEVKAKLSAAHDTERQENLELRLLNTRATYIQEHCAADQRAVANQNLARYTYTIALENGLDSLREAAANAMYAAYPNQQRAIQAMKNIQEWVDHKKGK